MDMSSVGCDAAFVCLSCGRTAVFDPVTLTQHLLVLGISTQLDVMTQRMRCKCGARDAIVTPVSVKMRPDPLPPPEVLAPLYVMPPGPRRRELLSAEQMMRDALSDPSRNMPAMIRMSDARKRLERARREMRNLRYGLDQ